jgi:hypothetical protein
MEYPASGDSKFVRDEKVKVFSVIQPDGSHSGPISGYGDEPSVAAESTHFAALHLHRFLALAGRGCQLL